MTINFVIKIATHSVSHVQFHKYIVTISQSLVLSSFPLFSFIKIAAHSVLAKSAIIPEGATIARFYLYLDVTSFATIPQIVEERANIALSFILTATTSCCTFCLSSPNFAIIADINLAALIRFLSR